MRAGDGREPRRKQGLLLLSRLGLVLSLALLSLPNVSCRASRASKAFVEIERRDSVEKVLSLAGKPCHDYSRPFSEEIERSATDEVERVLVFEISRTSELHVFLGRDGRVLFQLLAMRPHRQERCGEYESWTDLARRSLLK